ncbi:MAG: hypothetical protein Q9227_004426 [Pyrenula ochraceoflavens]
MFRRKRSASASASRPTTPASASAQLAASQAFLANRPSNGSLSNAAAAAALRSFTTSPTSVGELQTKRMVQRQSSTSSNGSAAARGLQRRDSGGSMTDRTFRTPSPNRPASRGQDKAPPVPPLPKNYGGHKRAASLEPPMRITSPVPKAPGGRGASLDRAPPKKVPTTPKLDDIEELERSNSRNSINFSYPMNARPNSPPATAPLSPKSPKAPTKITSVQDPASQSASKPVKKKKKKLAPGSAEGRHLANGGMGGKPHGAEFDRDSTQSSAKPQPKKRVVLSSGSDSDSTPEKAEKKSQRASGQLNKQPSVVREDWEGEQAADHKSNPTSPVADQTTPRLEKVAANSSKKVEMPSQSASIPATLPTPPPSEPPEHLVSKESPKARIPSLSPSRSTRFSAQIASELLGERKHEPPPRSISPAKSALKHHSPSSLTRSPVEGGGPGGWKRSSQTPSEASDNTSLASMEGSKKKRPMHVSFGAEPEVVDGSDASLKKAWFGSSKTQPLDTIQAEDDMEEVMKPRPALPSFGSIRGRKDKGESQVQSAPKTSNLSSSASSSESNLPGTMETSVSSDHAIGAILAQSRAKEIHRSEAPKIDPTLPLPPEVTSVEGTGYVSDNSSLYSVEEPIPDPPITSETTINEPDKALKKESRDLTIGTAEPVKPISRTENVPAIAVQPATPGSGTIPAQDEWLVNVPGGFPEIAELSDNESSRVSQGDKDLGSTSPTDAGIAEPTPLEAARGQDPSLPAVGSVSQSLLQQTQPESDAESTGGESIYSDAAEDVADLEGDGFGSINAIVESPNIRPTPSQSPPTSPLISKSMEKHQDSWEEAQAHWKEVAERQRLTAAQPVQKSEPIAIPPKSTARKPPVIDPVSTSDASPPSSPNRPLPMSSAYPPLSSKPKSAAKDTPMRRSMRSPPIEAGENTSMRKSMRAPTSDVHEPSIRESMRSPPPGRAGNKGADSSQPKTKPVLRPNQEVPGQKRAGIQPKGALQKRSIPTADSPSTTVATSKMRSRTRSNDSDSDSSFKKLRTTKNADGKYTMRRSMRSPPPTERPLTAASPVRPTSSENRRSFSAGGQGSLRTTMRSMDSTTPSLRASGRQRPSSSSSFPKKTSTSVKATTFKSRFGNDSDDEDSPRLFRSRFEDSSDEEPEPLNLRPVRGIPHRTDEEDSTDLEDSSDDGKRKPEKPKVQIETPKTDEIHTVRRQNSGSGRDPSKSAEPSQKKGLFGRFRSKKDNRISKPTTESSARMDTHLERTQTELEKARSPISATSPVGKLQRRSMPQRVMSETSWPLSEKEGREVNRPGTSDGVVKEVPDSRPSLPRENTASTLRTEGGTPVYGRSGKKKRFPMLRKALGLHD